MSQQTTVQTQSLAKPTFASLANGVLQRQCACGQHTSAGGECEACRKKREDTLRRAASNASPVYDVPPIVHEVLRSSGQPLDAATRAFMEPRFGHDFSGVRVHTDASATESARAVSARAYTVGQDVVFGAGQYAPQSNAGRRLMAHELAHTIQQPTGVSDAPDKLKLVTPQHSLEQEAEIAYRAVLQGRSAPAITRGTRQIARQESDAGTTDAGSHDAGTAPPPNLTIVRQGGTGNTFVSTDVIAFTAQVSGRPDANILSGQIGWTVYGMSTNSGSGNPHSAANKNSFSFTPNPTNRPTAGSRTPNDPIQYHVEAQVAGVTATTNLVQDETDTIRQEYIDLGPTAPPARAEIVVPSIATFNTGNYALIVDRGLNNALTNTQTQFQTLTQQAAAPGPGAAAPAAPGTVPATGPVAAPPPPVPAITVESGYRNPQRNVAVGSNFPVTSRHVWGSALDFGVAGANAVLWARLRQAGQNAGNTSICEHGPTQIPCNDPTVDHVHIQW